MNRDDIIRMAREAEYGEAMADLHAPALERFAALVISHHVNKTRPDISAGEEKWLQQIAYQHGGIGDLASHELEFGAMVAAAEREECAKVAAWILKMPENDISAAIRARGSND